MTATAPDPRPWDDPATPPERRAALLLAELTLPQKMAQVSCWFARDVTDTSELRERYPHGVGDVSSLEARSARSRDEVTAFQREVQRHAMSASGHDIPAVLHMEGVCGAYVPGATSFPAGIGRGAGFDPELERRIGQVVGRQERALGVTRTLAPVLDLARDPRLGRHGEAYGEDPALVAALGTAFTQGLQADDGTGTRTDAVAKHFLGSHRVAGGIHGAHVDVAERTLLEQDAAPFQAAITHAGLRGVMPSYNVVGGEPVTSSHHLLGTLLRERMGFDGMVVSDYGAIGNLHTVQRVAQSSAHAGLAAMSAGLDVELHHPVGFGPELEAWFADGRADVAVLDRAVLRVLTAKFRMGLFEHPFAPDAPERDAAFGREDDAALTLASARASLVLLRNDGTLPLRPDLRRVLVVGPHATTARSFFGGYTHYSMAEGKLAANASMAGLAGVASSRPVTTVPGTAVEASDDPEYAELLEAQQPGIRSLLEELRARLPHAEVAWARGYEVVGADTTSHAEALRLATTADLVLLTLGGKHGTSSIATMGEGIDATDIGLPRGQEQLVEALAGLGVPLVGVHLDGRPISSDVADAHLAAVLEAWSPAEAGARAVVDVLTGEVDPSGRLPVTVARNAGQVPISYDHPWGSAWHQGASIGFPDYVDAPHTPRYPFGHGLSYTTFGYDDLTLSAAQVDPDGTVDITVTITNTGDRAGTEVVQLYVSDRYASLARPVLQLAGFARAQLEPRGRTRIGFRLAASQLAFVGRDGRWCVEAGDVDVHLGASSADLRLSGSFRITADAVVDGTRRATVAAVL